MIITAYHVAKAKPRARMRLAKALGLKARASILDIVKAANAHSLKPGCRFPCFAGDGPQCSRCAELYPST